ncbi:protein kinase domain-containing protein [Haliangium sp.]|uniref:nSTAND1 domain-containing NTPase n=1 Tax=Haliangium sp. TaxID=2663208 RepID=UPI003D14902E
MSERFELVRVLGRGGMGTVYLAWDRELRRDVAVKSIAVGKVASDAALAREAWLTAQVNHPNVVTVHDVVVEAGAVHIVSEYVEGTSLDHIETPVPWDKALAWGLDLARGLAAAHARDVLHRDIKPANAIVHEATGRATLIDFGVGKLVVGATAPGSATAEIAAGEPATPNEECSDAAASRAAASTVPATDTASRPCAHMLDSHLNPPYSRPGTPRYQAPELWQGKQADARSDVYGLGLVLRELCTGELPPAPDDPAARRPLRIEREDIDARFASIVNRCLAFEPAERYASAQELAEDLAERAAAPTTTMNPYRGLLSFGEQHRGLFFGREHDIARVVERVRAQPLVLLVGDSGVGKSSLAQAGVLPRLSEDQRDPAWRWHACRMVPGRRPLDTLVQLLLAHATGVAAARGAIADEAANTADAATPAAQILDPRGRLDRDALAAFVRALMADLDGAGTRLVLFLDQLEELAVVSEPAQAQAAQALITALVEAQSGSVRVLGAVRGDYLTALLETAELGPLLQDQVYFVRSPDPDGVRAAIVEPARLMGVRFESQALVERLVDSVRRSPAGMPLLQFVLAELWEARDVEGARITESSLGRMGDIAGALARHADQVIAELSRSRHEAARRILIRLVSVHHRTRLRCTRDDLVGADAAATEVLEHLVRRRLVVGHNKDGEHVYSLVHEALLVAWPRLGRWLEQERSLAALKANLAEAVAAWERTGRARDALWDRHFVRETERLGDADLSPAEAEFLTASRRRLWRRRWGARAAVVAVIGLVVAIYAGSRYQAQRALMARVDARLAKAQQHLDGAAALHGEYLAAHARTQALLQADEDGWQSTWQTALALYPQVTAVYGEATQVAEAAFALDPGREDVVELLARCLDGRARLADTAGRREEHDELTQRLGLLAPTRAAAWRAPVAVAVTTEPTGGDIEVLRHVWHRQTPFESELVLTGIQAPYELRLEPGSYTIVVRASGPHVEVRYPLVVEPRARTDASASSMPGTHVAGQPAEHILIPRPRVTQVPAGYVFVPAGAYLRGYGQVPGDEDYRTWHEAPPLHRQVLGAFLIGRHEVKVREWLAFVDACAGGSCAGIEPPSRRIEATLDGMHLLIAHDDAMGWHIRWKPGANGPEYRATAGEPLVYQGRYTRQRQDWLEMPVSGVSWREVQAYLVWLRTERGVRGADLCTEAQWERAARGADDRLYPHGNGLFRSHPTRGVQADVNIDVTYGQVPSAFGPDVTGSYPVSASPFGVLDMAGNVAELTRPKQASASHSEHPAMVAVRGGAFYYASVDSRVFNRWEITSEQRVPMVGFRVCALAPE